MAILHVASAGSATPPYETWAKAGTSYATVLAAAAAGDVVYVHNEPFTVAADVTLTNSGTEAAPIIVLSVNKASETDGTTCAYTAGASLKTITGTYDINTNGHVRSYGVDYVASDVVAFTAADSYWYFEDCQVGMSGTSAFDQFTNTQTECRWDFVNVEFTFGHVDQGFYISTGNRLVVRNCTIAAAGSAVVKFTKTIGARGQQIEIDNCDFSNMGTSGEIIGVLPSAVSGQPSTYRISNCKLPTSGVVTSQSAVMRGLFLEARGCATTSQPTATYILQYEGSAIDDTATYLDTENLWSLKVTATTDSKELYHPIRVLLATVFAEANATIRVEGMVDLVTLPNDDEIWIEIEYPDATVTNWNKTYSSRGPLNAAPTILDASTSVTWVEALTNNNEFYISTTLTSGAGMHNIYVNVANASGLTAWFDSKILVT